MKLLYILALLSSYVFAQLPMASSIRKGDRIQINEGIAKNSFYDLKKDKRNFLVRFVESTPYILHCETYVSTQYRDESGTWQDGISVILKDTPMVVTAVTVTTPEDFDRNFKSIARQKIAVTAFNKGSPHSKDMDYLNITCERPSLASRKVRNMPITLDEVHRALRNDIEIKIQK